jgi:hypothetical protein
VTNYYYELARTLRGIADDIETLAVGDLRPLSGVSLLMQPDGRLPDDDKVATIDAVAAAVIGEPGRLRKMTSGGYHHDAGGSRGPVNIGVFAGVAAPEDREKDREIARLRAALERLDAGRSGDGSYRCEGCGKTSRITRHEPGCPVAAVTQ